MHLGCKDWHHQVPGETTTPQGLIQNILEDKKFLELLDLFDFKVNFYVFSQTKFNLKSPHGMKKTLHVNNIFCDEIMKEKVTFDISSNFGAPGK